MLCTINDDETIPRQFVTQYLLAYLLVNDAKLTTEEVQELTNQFYKPLQQTARGINLFNTASCIISIVPATIAQMQFCLHNLLLKGLYFALIV